MKFYKQLNRHDPVAGIYGDCQRTVVGCFLDMEPASVPHFNDGAPDAVEFNRRIDAFLGPKGLSRMMIAFNANGGLEGVLKSMQASNPGFYYCLSGMSRTGVNHVVIAKDDAIVWDTSINDSGIVGPCDDGYFWVDWFVPLFMKA